MEENKNISKNNQFNKNVVYSKFIRNKRRTYFFDVKLTKNGNYYLIIKESKKYRRFDGRFFYRKHKIFLYERDFEKFTKELKGAIEYIQNVPKNQ